MIRVTSSGNWDKTRLFLNRMMHRDEFKSLDDYGRMGVAALASATPVQTGLTASSWYYVIKMDRKRPKIEWHNDNLDGNGSPVVILIQYGHGTGTGGYVQGRDFINPAILPIFEQIADDIWKKVTA